MRKTSHLEPQEGDNVKMAKGELSDGNYIGLSSIPGLGRSPGEGKGYPLQRSGLENAMDCIVHGVTELDRTERLLLS